MVSWCSSGARTEPAFISESGVAPSTSSGPGVPHLRLPRLCRDGPGRALRPQSPNAGLGVRGVLGKGRAGAALLSDTEHHL